MRPFEKLMESRVSKLRLGQASGEVVDLAGAPGEDPVQFILVPITDGDYLTALSMADEIAVSGSSAGEAARDVRLRQAILLFSAREIGNWERPFFSGLDEVAKLETHEVMALYDVYLEMTHAHSPSLNMLSDEMVDELKKVWERIEWSELSGQQWYAAMRFLNSIRNELHQASFFGSPSTSSLTTTKSEPTDAQNATEK